MSNEKKIRYPSDRERSEMDFQLGTRTEENSAEVPFGLDRFELKNKKDLTSFQLSNFVLSTKKKRKARGSSHNAMSFRSLVIASYVKEPGQKSIDTYR